jgi:hypothetical protein
MKVIEYSHMNCIGFMLVFDTFNLKCRYYISSVTHQFAHFGQIMNDFKKIHKILNRIQQNS